MGELFGDHQAPLVTGTLTHWLAQQSLEILDADFSGSRLVHHRNDNENRVPRVGVDLGDCKTSVLYRGVERFQAFLCNVTEIVREVATNGLEIGPLGTWTKPTSRETGDSFSSAFQKSQLAPIETLRKQRRRQRRACLQLRQNDVESLQRPSDLPVPFSPRRLSKEQCCQEDSVGHVLDRVVGLGND